jgi:hypothetical protein
MLPQDPLLSSFSYCVRRCSPSSSVQGNSSAKRCTIWQDVAAAGRPACIRLMQTVICLCTTALFVCVVCNAYTMQQQLPQHMQPAYICKQHVPSPALRCVSAALLQAGHAAT